MSCYYRSTYTAMNSQVQQISALLVGSTMNLELISQPTIIEYGEAGSLLRLHSTKISSFLSTIQEIIELGDTVEGLNHRFYNVDNLLRNREVLEAILENPEYLEGVLEEYPPNYFESADGELRLVSIIPMPNDQYILEFLISTGLYQPINVYFLFSVKDGVEEDPLILTFINGRDKLEVERLNPESSSVDGGSFYGDEDENEYFYFRTGRIGRAYIALKYSIDNGQLRLEEQITGVRRERPNDEEVFSYEITRRARQVNEWIEASRMECLSSMTFFDMKGGISLCRSM